jgi:hypothetical protein
MNIFQRVVSFPLYVAIIIVLLIAAVITGYFSFNVSNQWGVIFGGICTGLIVAIIQMLIQAQEHNDVEKLRRLGIREVLPHREGKEYYQALIEQSKKRVWVLGVTAYRFLEDFAHKSRDDSQALISKMKLQNVDVRVLLPKTQYLSKEDQARASSAYERIGELRKEFSNFQVRYFDHIPIHSIVCADEECLVGPVFPKVPSRDSPAIHVVAFSTFVKHYMEFFEQEWKDAQQSPE